MWTNHLNRSNIQRSKVHTSFREIPTLCSEVNKRNFRNTHILRTDMIYKLTVH